MLETLEGTANIPLSIIRASKKEKMGGGLCWFLPTCHPYGNKEPRRKQRGILKTNLSYFTPQEAGNMTHRDLRNKIRDCVIS